MVTVRVARRALREAAAELPDPLVKRTRSAAGGQTGVRPAGDLRQRAVGGLEVLRGQVAI